MARKVLPKLLEHLEAPIGVEVEFAHVDTTAYESGNEASNILVKIDRYNEKSGGVLL